MRANPDSAGRVDFGHPITSPGTCQWPTRRGPADRQGLGSGGRQGLTLAFRPFFSWVFRSPFTSSMNWAMSLNCR